MVIKAFEIVQAKQELLSSKLLKKLRLHASLVFFRQFGLSQNT